ncbi:hypothetical protein H9P43_004431 [Blastocladiella emersonii ATCC 22665]|nr:hypothetical protein H9P43_004431 [Blastocladiella emersonii ATCC 22665]
MTDRVLKKLKISLENGDYYGAHQMYLTVCNRYVKGKKLDEAVELLTTGTKLLVEHKQYGSALDMATVIVKTWTDESTPVTDAMLGRLLDLLDLFAGDSREFGELVNSGIKWSAKNGEFATGEPALHHHVGVTYADAGMFDKAHRHFMLGTADSAESLAVLLLKRATTKEDEGPLPTTAEMAYMALAPAMQYLSSHRFAYALTFFNTFVRHLEELDPAVKATSLPTPVTTSNHFTVYAVPVLNFVHLVLLTSQRGPAAAQGFQVLCSQYAGAYAQDDIPLLERVGETVFGLRTQKPQGNNMLQELMSSLLGGMQ